MAVVLAAILPACGNDGGTTPTPTRERIGAGTFNVGGTVEANAAGYEADVATGAFNLVQSGTVDFTVDWTSPANNVDVFLYLGPCSAAQARIGFCAVANRSTSTTAKPERLTVFGVPAGSYTIGFANFGPTSETGTFEIHLTR